MKIAFLADPLDNQTAGIHVYTREIIKAITQLETSHEFLIIRAKEGNEDFGEAKQIIVPVESFPPFHLRLRQLFSIPKILIRENVDIVIEPAHFGPFNLPEQIKRVTVIHDLTPLLFPQFHPFMSVLFHKVFLKRTLRQTDLVITNSLHTANDVIRQFPFTKDKIEPILLGKNESYVPKEKRMDILQKYNIRPPYFLHTGTLEPRKNLMLLLQAFEAWKQQTGKPHQLVLAGKKGWQIDDLYEAIDQSLYKNDICLTGFVVTEDIPYIYSVADCFIYPSKYEGFGLPILEAMSCGTPVICSNTSSMPEVGGAVAYYIDPNNKMDVVRQMNQVLMDKANGKLPIEKMTQQANPFSWEQTAKKTLQVLEDLLSSSE